MIDTIIIFGTGKAAWIHYSKYKELDKIKNIYFIDPMPKFNYISNNIYSTLEELILQKNISSQKTVVDICTPKSEFEKIILNSVYNGFENIIVEKPFVTSKSFFEDKPNIKILMVENYKYSVITNFALNYIKTKKLKVKKIYTNFSKNRIKESFNKRGMLNLNDAPTVFEIEMPHQIYLANLFLNINNGNKKINYISCLDMNNNGNFIKKHGYGLVLYNINKKSVIHESDMMTNNFIRKIIVFCNKKTTIEINYIIYDNNHILKKGEVKIYKNGKIYKKQLFTKDDNMKKCLSNYIEILDKNKYNERYKKEILDFSNELSSYLEEIK